MPMAETALAWLREQLLARRALAEAGRREEGGCWGSWTGLPKPREVMADIDARLALLDEVAGWTHDYLDPDPYWSCAQAIDPHAGPEPGSGCADEDRAGKPCDCGLEARRLRVAAGLAGGLSGHPDFPAELSR